MPSLDPIPAQRNDQVEANSDDEADPELVELLRQHFGLGERPKDAPPETKEYSTHTWSEHELHPQTKDESTVDFIFTMDLLNFSFWSEEEEEPKRFCIEYRGKLWTGYWSLVAALQRALDEGQSR